MVVSGSMVGGVCYCKVVAVDMVVSGRQVDVIERWLLKAGKYSFVSGSMVERLFLL